jgi:hypothetical protein
LDGKKEEAKVTAKQAKKEMKIVVVLILKPFQFQSHLWNFVTLYRWDVLWGALQIRKFKRVGSEKEDYDDVEKKKGGGWLYGMNKNENNRRK